MFAFAYFHAIVQERRKFGPIGWNIPYGFTNEDLATCRRQALHFLDKYEEVPYKVVYLVIDYNKELLLLYVELCDLISSQN